MTDAERSSLQDPVARRRRIDEIFDAALDLERAERASFLDGQCPDDLRPDVDRLLASITEGSDQGASGGSFVREGGALRCAFGEELAEIMDEEAPLQPGDRVGAYRVESEIGRGGMAAVYLARRDDDNFEQKVALKVALVRHHGPRSRARFELERQILAGLRHPNIAQLLDGGVTEDGHPFFAMEWVDGQPIDRYCDEERLPIEQRLALFVEVGRAVEAAHRQLVVHRDLKPKNVLVADGGTGEGPAVKLLDFGIAKVLSEDDLGVVAGLTRTAVPMTPEYASPEQLGGEVLGGALTTAVDVYQLGLLLFELLCGRRPFADLSLVERIARDHTPTRPSVFLASDEAKAIAEHRSTDLRALRRQISGDLETIVLTALRKEPERRYASAKALADDVQAYLDGRPIEARSDSLLYRAGKLVRRNVGASVAVAASLVLLVAVVTFSMLRLRQERDVAEAARTAAEQATTEAEEVVDFLVDLFRVSQGGKVQAESISALDLLERGTEKIEDDPDLSPLVRARLLDTLAVVNRDLGLFTQSEQLARQSVEVRQSEQGDDSVEVARSLDVLGATLLRAGRREEALDVFRRAFEIRDAHLPADDPDVADALNSMSAVLSGASAATTRWSRFCAAPSRSASRRTARCTKTRRRCTRTWGFCCARWAASTRPRGISMHRSAATAPPSAPTRRVWRARSTPWRWCGSPRAATTRPSRCT